jgi:hypothetical protein
MYELSWKEIIENDSYSLVSQETGEVFDNIEQAISAGDDFWIYRWDNGCGWVLVDEVVW